MYESIFVRMYKYICVSKYIHVSLLFEIAYLLMFTLHMNIFFYVGCMYECKFLRMNECTTASIY